MHEDADLDAIEGGELGIEQDTLGAQDEEDSLHQLTDLHDALEANASQLASLGVQAPTGPLLAIETELTGELNAKLAAYDALLSGDVAAYDQAAYAAGAPTLAAGKPITVATPPPIH